ncbi:hypothetical protein Tco_1482053 [Tanacetum coccineum]
MSVRELLLLEKLHKALQAVCEKLNQQEQTANVSTYTPEPSRGFNFIYDDDDDDEESTIPLNEITFQIPSSIAITTVLPTMKPEDSLIMGDENLSTIPEKELDEFIKSNVEVLVPFLSESEDTFDSDKECDFPFCDNSVTFFDANDDFTSSNDESLPEEYAQEVLEFSDNSMSGNSTTYSESVVESPSLLPTPFEDSDSLVEETDALLSHFNDSPPEYETYSFDIEEKSNGSTIIPSEYSFPDYEAFYLDESHIEEKSSGSTTTHSDFSLHEYDSFIFDLSIDPFPLADRSVSHHEEFADDLAHIISPPEYDRFYFGLEIVSREFTKVLEKIFKIYSNPLFDFDDKYISSDINPLFDDVLEDECFDPGDDANEDECFDPGDDIDEIDDFLDIDTSSDFEDDYYDSEGDIIYLESFLIKDTTHNLLPEVFLDHDPKNLKDEPDNENLKSMIKVFDPGIHEEFISPTYVKLPFEDRHYLSLTYVIRIFLPYFTYPVESSFFLSSGSDDTIFDPGISAFHFSSLEPVASHRSRTFMCFNVYPNILNESPMEICSSTCFVPNITMIWGESS